MKKQRFSFPFDALTIVIEFLLYWVGIIFSLFQFIFPLYNNNISSVQISPICIFFNILASVTLNSMLSEVKTNVTIALAGYSFNRPLFAMGNFLRDEMWHSKIQETR